MRRDDRRHSRGRRLGRDHAERLREDRRHDGDVAEREQVDEVTVLERAGEDRPGRRDRLERLAVVAEADDDGADVEAAQRLEQHLHALVLDQLADVDDRGLVARERVLEARRVAGIGMALVAVLRVELGLRDQAGERAQPVLGRELVDVDARRNLVHAVDVADDVLEHGADVRRADEDRLRAGERLRSPALQLRSSAHRVLELGAVRLHRVARTARGADRPAEEHVVREHEVGRQQFAHGGGVRLDVAVALLDREVLQQPRLEALVAVEHEDRQQAVGQIGHDDARAAEVVPLRVPLLAHDRDVVARRCSTHARAHACTRWSPYLRGGTRAR